MANNLGIDMITKRPRTPRDPYTTLTNTQIKNIPQKTTPFFMASRPEKPYPDSGWTRDRYATNMSEHFIRGPTRSEPYCYVDYQWQRNPPEMYNTCRLGASERWGQEKQGSRTVQHFNKAEDVNRFLSTEVYRRAPTNQPGKVDTSYGRPADGYYTQRNPNATTWFGSTVPLNRTQVLTPMNVYPKTMAQYAAIREQEQHELLQRKNKFPAYSEYNDRFSLQTKIEPIMNTRQRKKMYLQEAA